MLGCAHLFLPYVAAVRRGSAWLIAYRTTQEGSSRRSAILRRSCGSWRLGPAEGAYGRRDIPLTARLALIGWMTGVEGITLDWLGHQELDRAAVRALLTRLLRATLRTIEELEPSCPAPSTTP